MRFFIDYLWDFSETPHQQWAVFAEERDKTVLYFKSLHGKPAAAERVCNRAKYDYARLHTTTDIGSSVMAHPEVKKKLGKKGQEIGYELK